MAPQRQHHRFPFSSELEICREGQAGWILARGNDISTGGVGFETALPLTIGERIRLALSRCEERVNTELVVRHIEAADGRFMVGASL